MTPASTVRLALAVALMAGGTVASTAASSQPAPRPASAPATQTTSAFGGAAFGSAGHLGTVFQSGKSAFVPMCTANLGVTHADTTHQSSNPQVGKIGNVHTSVAVGRIRRDGRRRSARRPRRPAACWSALVTGKAFVATARSGTSPAGTSLTGGTTLTDVRIAGHAAPQHPAVNQSMALPGVGSVLLNHQTPQPRLRHAADHRHRDDDQRSTATTRWGCPAAGS